MVGDMTGGKGPAPAGGSSARPRGPGGGAAGAERMVAGFGRALRYAGLAVPTGSLVLFTEAVALVGVDRPDRVYWAGRATLVRRVEDVPVYDRVFGSYWRGLGPGPPAPKMPPPPAARLAVDDGDEDTPESRAPQADEGADRRVLRYSPHDVTSRTDIAGLTSEEWAELQRLISELRVVGEQRRTRRTRPSKRRSGRHPDLRLTARRNLRHGGVPLRRVWRAGVDRPRRLVFLLDVSGSMEPYARALAHFAHAAVSARRSGQVEVFTIGTRLTRVTRDLARRDPEAALRCAVESVADWSGGTRIGASIREFNDTWGARGAARGALVVICSDGWDRGQPEIVASEMARLWRVARRVIWVNPLKASEGYAPIARGMAAALPYVDRFLEGHSLSSLERLAALLAHPTGRVAAGAVV